jgi:MOSC domain-containing protein YiiM
MSLSADAPPTSQGRVVEILISRSPADPMESRKNVMAVPGLGLEGDRYAAGLGTFSPHPPKPDFEVTLIEKEKVEAFATETGLCFTSRQARRNLVTEGIDLNALVGRDFRVGGAVLRGLRLCEPCNYLAKTTFPQVLQGLLHKAGLRAQVLSEGMVRVGDPVGPV